MGWFGESTAHKQNRYQKEQNAILQQYNLENMEIQQGYNIENMERQWNYDLQAFQMENEYNSPIAQRERMHQAGLNPNWSDTAAIGQMDSGVSPAMPAGGAHGSSPVSGSDMSDMAQLAQMAMMRKQQQQIDADIDLKKAQADKTLSEKNLNEMEFTERPKNYRSERQTKQTQGWLNQSQASYYDAQKLVTDKAYQWYDANQNAQIERYISELHLNEEQANKIRAMLPYDMKESMARTANYASQTYRNYEEVKQQKYSLVLRGKEINIAAATLKEMHRHNVSLEKLQKFSSEVLAEFQKSQTRGQDIKNDIWDIERLMSRYSVKNGIAQELLNTQLQVLRTNMYLAEEQIKNTHADTENKENIVTNAIVSSLCGRVVDFGFQNGK